MNCLNFYTRYQYVNFPLFMDFLTFKLAKLSINDNQIHSTDQFSDMDTSDISVQNFRCDIFSDNNFLHVENTIFNFEPQIVHNTVTEQNFMHPKINIPFSFEDVGTATIHDYVPIKEQLLKNRHIVVDSLNLLLGIQSITNKNSNTYGFMDLRSDDKPIEDHHFSCGADMSRAFETMLIFFDVFPNNSTIHLVFKRMGSDMLWNQCLCILNSVFLNPKQNLSHRYQIYIAKPISCNDTECDDRLVNVLANFFSTIKENEVHLLSNDKYRSLHEHWENSCYFDLFSNSGKYENQYVTKTNFVGNIKKHGFNVTPQFEIMKSSWNIVCSLKN